MYWVLFQTYIEYGGHYNVRTLRKQQCMVVDNHHYCDSLRLQLQRRQRFRLQIAKAESRQDPIFKQHALKTGPDTY